MNWESATSSKRRLVDSHPGKWCKLLMVAVGRHSVRYDEIRSLYVDQLVSAWTEDATTEATTVSIDKKIDSFGQGDLEHATDILSTLWEIMNTDGDIKATPTALPTVSCAQFYLPRVIPECRLHLSRSSKALAPHSGLL